MRFQRLHIPAFGPFTNLEFAFPSVENDLHLIYGNNEAGKSSLLRAIRDLLFGIHGKSRDNFQHDYKNLRVCGEIENRAGKRLAFQRRKGNKDTLLDRDGKPLPDGSLVPFLGSVDQAYFSAMFGLGSSELRDGAVQLLAGKGEIGNALFSASLGGTPIQHVQDALINEAERLYKRKATTSVTIRPAANRYKELLRQSRDATVNAETWDQLEKNLALQVDSKKRLEEEIGLIVRDLTWIQRCEDALPSVGRLTDEMKSLNELPALPDVGSDFVERARAARTAVGAASDKAQALADRIAQLDSQLANCATAANVIAVADALDLLHEDLGAYREQKKTMTKIRTEVAGIEPILRAGMKSLEVEGELESLETLRLSSAVLMSCGEAASALRDALNKQIENKNKAEALNSDIENDQQELTLLSETDLTPLREALAEAAEATEANKTLTASQSTVDKLIRTIATEQALAPGVPQDFDAASRLSVPAPATIRKFRERFANLDRESKASAELSGAAKENVKTFEDDLRRLERRGELPSEESLKQAREHRDLGWQLVLADWKGEGAKEDLNPTLPLVDAFPLAIAKADKIADQLRLDAEAVAQAEEKRHQIQNSQEKLANANSKLALIQRQVEECQQSWEAEWAPIGISARTPDEMEGWRENWVRLRDSIGKLREAEAEVISKGTKVKNARTALAAALMDSPEKPFSVLFEAARNSVQQGEESIGARKSIEKRLEKEAKNLESLDRKSAALRQHTDAAEAHWKQLCRSIGLAESTSPESGQKLLTERKDLIAQFDRRNKLSDEANTTALEIQRYEQRVSEIAVSLGIAAGSIESEEAAIWSSLSQARNAQAKHDQLIGQIAEAQAERSLSKHALKTAKEALDELIRIANLDAPESLEPLLAAVEKFKAVKDRIDSYRETLSGLARGQGLDEFIASVQAEDGDALPQRRTLLEASQAVKTAELQAIQAVLDALNAQRKELEKAGDAAADFRQQAEAVAASLKQDASRYIRLRLAAHFLHHQIERFRKENQGPLLEKSGQVFKQMTQSAFDGLAAEFNEADVPVMVGRRASGVNVPVEGMSDGSRDQLYLALRIAAMERYLENHEPMPLILDDLLITFDNERTRAILPQLVNIAKKTQVFLFTHHEHLVNLCRETIGEDQFTLHRISS